MLPDCLNWLKDTKTTKRALPKEARPRITATGGSPPFFSPGTGGQVHCPRDRGTQGQGDRSIVPPQGQGFIGTIYLQGSIGTMHLPPCLSTHLTPGQSYNFWVILYFLAAGFSNVSTTPWNYLSNFQLPINTRGEENVLLILTSNKISPLVLLATFMLFLLYI